MRLNLPRLDANETVFLSRQLETIDPVNYMTLFAGLLGRRYIPLVENVSPLDNAYTYKMFTVTGDGERVGSSGGKANDLPTVTVTMTDATSNIKQIDAEYGWGVREIQQAAKNNVPLDSLTIQAAMSYIARKQDKMLAFGESGTNITGLLNNDDIQSTTPSTKSGSGAGTAWIRTVPVSPDEILADISKLVADCRKRLKQASRLPGGDSLPAFDRFVILLDTANYAYIAQTPRSANSDLTILQYALRNNPFLESIEEWWQCDDANDAGNNVRSVCYPRDPMCLGAVLPVDFQSLPPQERGKNIAVPCNGSCGGTVIRYPVACGYMDING